MCKQQTDGAIEGERERGEREGVRGREGEREGGRESGGRKSERE